MGFFRVIFKGINWLREADLNHRPSGYEPDELPNCSIPRQDFNKCLNLFGVEVYLFFLKERLVIPVDGVEGFEPPNTSTKN